jgi:hypothetical protein
LASALQRDLGIGVLTRSFRRSRRNWWRSSSARGSPGARESLAGVTSGGCEIRSKMRPSFW